MGTECILADQTQIRITLFLTAFVGPGELEAQLTNKGLADLQPHTVTDDVVSIIFRFSPGARSVSGRSLRPDDPAACRPKGSARDSSAAGGIRTPAAINESASYRFLVARSARSAVTAVAHYPNFPKGRNRAPVSLLGRGEVLARRFFSLPSQVLAQPLRGAWQ